MDVSGPLLESPPAAPCADAAADSAYGLHLDDFFVYFPNALGLASATAQLGCFAKYGIHKA